MLLFVSCAISATAQAATTITYVYDDLNRLESVSRSDGPGLTYGYDEVSNITLHTSTNPDSDGDLLKDIEENAFGTNPNLSDSDGDNVNDYDEVCYDGDCTTYDPYHPVTNASGTDLNANEVDTDFDGFNDDVEIAAGTNPLDALDLPITPDGDLNDDGLVNAADLVLATRIVLGNLIPTADQLLHGDVAPLVGGVPQPDGNFNAGDLLLIQRKVLDPSLF